MIRFWPRTAARRRLAASALLAGAAGCSTAGYFVATALASPAVAPTLSSSASYSRPARDPGPGVLIISAPARQTTQTSARFTFVSTSRGQVTFSCRLDGATAGPCTGRSRVAGEGTQRFTGLVPGRHCFHVRATSRAGQTGPAASYCWTIITIGGKRDFTVGGDLTSPLYPGTSQPLDLTFTNPGTSRLTIARGAIARSNITITSDAPGCSASNFTVVQGLTTSVTVPARQRTAVSLSALGVPQADWPVIEMIETHTDQDACQGVALRLTYSGIEAAG